ncbi:family 10 glycosylhydrolase [Paenibacillus sp. N3/727]|uniref:family 10 glycosylhydrolase n=1 Tax=Paenibacillus sp. N3/727 TaxID=2925845 RepID=UPI001F53053C|nr:family 10 glycosylhydrolase [Paenibacillus sp. N3/727]UNK20375.1 family 10 glycosylhydrolase [Paenibacillus sp. N3/727]
MKFRRWLLVLLLSLLCLPSVVPAAQAKSPGISIFLDGQKLDSDISPYILPKVNVTMVPTRVISEGLGASVNWDQKSKTVTVSKDGLQLVMTSGRTTALVNGSSVSLDASVQIKNSRVMVPIRFISENLGLTVKWNQAAQQISLTSTQVTPPVDPGIPVPDNEKIRGVWISTVFNLDWPSTKNNILKQQNEYTALLDTLQDTGINAVFVQVRPAGDALYPSEIVPWSKVLTGTQGVDPGYDPLAFMVEETHRRGMEFHAWFNPFRANSETSTAGLAPNHVALTHPEWMIKVNNQLMINPGIPEARQHIIDTIMEVVNGYEIDGIHLDDYFYPSNATINDAATYKTYNDGSYTDIGDWRRGNINTFVQTLGDSINRVKPSVEFGISPFGVWRNKSADPTGSDTSAGVTAYDSMYADLRTWIRNGWIDYIAPQIYWSMNFTAADYDKLVDWWVNEVKGTDVDLLIGHAAYKVGDLKQEKSWHTASEIIAQLQYNEQFNEIDGSIFFRAKNLISNPLGLLDQLKLYYQS